MARKGMTGIWGAGEVPGARSLLGRVNPCVKLLALVLMALALTFVFDPATPAVLFMVILAAGCIAGGLSLGSQLRPLVIFVAAGVPILLGNVLFNKGNAAAEALAYLGPLKITGVALSAAGSLWLRLLCFALLSLVFVKTTEPQDLMLSLVHQLHINFRVAFGTMVGYRMLPALQSDLQTIRAAQRVRGVQDMRGLVHWWSRIRRYAIPLLAGGVRKAGRVAIAMDARAFGALPSRTYRRRMTVGRRDAIFLGAVVFVTALVIAGLYVIGVARFALW